ncbi:MAG: hypothetical protein KDD02_26780 [Phaeodactylibacter sp.]|nr:hypothetical protein [Phaeodactylibacter sp.]MCB9304933.1 hypothetical protein [Lewinellaceae bacterium]
MKKDPQFALYALVLTTMLLSSPSLQAQPANGNFRNATIGASATFIWEPELANPNTGESYTFREWSYNFNFGTDYWGKRMRTGIQGLLIRNRSFDNQRANSGMVGLFQQYNFVPRWRQRLYLETSLNYGNYCTCGAEDPYRQAGLYYWGLGGGLNVPLKKAWSLDLGFFNYEILNRTEGKYNYTQYVIGVDYRLGTP